MLLKQNVTTKVLTATGDKKCYTFRHGEPITVVFAASDLKGSFFIDTTISIQESIFNQSQYANIVLKDRDNDAVFNMPVSKFLNAVFDGESYTCNIKTYGLFVIDNDDNLIKTGDFITINDNNYAITDMSIVEKIMPDNKFAEVLTITLCDARLNMCIIEYRIGNIVSRDDEYHIYNLEEGPEIILYKKHEEGV